MVTTREQPMGRFSVDIDLANADDIARARAGDIPANQIRRARVSGVVDSGAARLVVPEGVAKQLGVEISGRSKVRYADGHTQERGIARRVQLSFAGREGVFNAIVEPGREDALIGAIVMEDLDLLVDCTVHRLIPRDPEQIISEIE